jgi:AcrR family transcriptional regulator
MARASASSSAKPGKQPNTRRLTREEIVEAALVLADREGLESATMRRIAQALGVGTMTLYTYFRDKDELLDAAVDHAAASVDIPEQGGPWRVRLRGLMKEIHRSLIAHPSGVELRMKRPLLSPAALRTTEAGMQILQAAGFTKAQAAHAWRLLFVYTFGYSAFTPPEVSVRTRREWRRLLARLPAEGFPALSGAADEAVETMSGEAAYDHGLDRILDGLEASLSS